MYSSNPCGGCGLGAYDYNTGTVAVAETGAWWEDPLSRITGAAADRIAGRDASYSGTMAPMTYAPQPRAGITPTTGILLALAGVAVLKFANVF